MCYCGYKNVDLVDNPTHWPMLESSTIATVESRATWGAKYCSPLASQINHAVGTYSSLSPKSDNILEVDQKVYGVYCTRFIKHLDQFA